MINGGHSRAVTCRIIGYDDAPSAAYAAPTLTSVRIPWREMTVIQVAALRNLCDGGR
jgi:LacI family transcriptional regulator